MFVWNLKFSRKLVVKLLFVVLFVIVIVFTGVSIYRTFNYEGNSCVPNQKIANISSDNYTDILKAVHENLDEYVGQKISFTGYVYRVYDFSDTQFVLARNMVVGSDKQTLVVGFLCDYAKACDFEDETWVNITGKITKGDYHGEIPVIEITDIKKCDKPADEFVLPPDDTYIPTSALF